MSRIPTTSTLIPQLPIFLDALPTPPQPHPKPLAPLGRAPKRINDYRDLFQELDDLSEEETEVEEIASLLNIYDNYRNEIKNRGANWLVPLGRQQTLQEEKNDASLSPSEAGSVSNGPPSNGDDNENESVQDLDASMLDLDEVDAEPEEDEGVTMTDDQDVSVNNLSLAEE